MAKRLFIGNLPYSATTQAIMDIFAKFGKVIEANVITDKFTGRSKGFAFVEMEVDAEADKAVEELNGKFDMEGRKLVVNEARPREERSFDSGNRGGGFGGRRDFDRDRRPSGGNRNRY